MASKKPLILVTNDDGITAPGIRTLISIMKDLGEVCVVAPDRPQSAMGHAITINNTLYSKRIQLFRNPRRLRKNSFSTNIRTKTRFMRKRY